MNYININKRLSKLKNDLDEILSKKEVKLEDIIGNNIKCFYSKEKRENNKNINVSE